MVAGTTPVLTVTCLNTAGEELPGLADSTATLRYRIGDGDLITRPMTVTPPNVEYQFTSEEVIAGLLEAEVEVVDASGVQILVTEQTIELPIRKRV